MMRAAKSVLPPTSEVRTRTGLFGYSWECTAKVAASNASGTPKDSIIESREGR